MKKKILGITISTIIIIGISLLLIINKNSVIIEKISKLNFFAKNYETSEKLQEVEEGILPIKISYSDLSVETTVADIIQKADSVKDNKISSKNNKMAKVEIHRSKIDTTDIEVIYNIEISNEGNEEGNVDKVIIKIPENMSIVQENNIRWEKIDKNTFVYDDFGAVEENKSKNIQVKLAGSAGELIGESIIETMLISSEEADQRVVEQDDDIIITEENVEKIMKDTNNYSSASTIISISTRLKDYALIALVILIVLIVIGVITKKLIIKNKEKSRS